MLDICKYISFLNSVLIQFWCPSPCRRLRGKPFFPHIPPSFHRFFKPWLKPDFFASTTHRLSFQIIPLHYEPSILNSLQAANHIFQGSEVCTYRPASPKSQPPSSLMMKLLTPLFLVSCAPFATADTRLTKKVLDLMHLNFTDSPFPSDRWDRLASCNLEVRV